MKRLAAVLLLLCLSTPAFAGNAAPAEPGASKEPIEISAAHSLAWNRKDHTYVARKDVVAKQGAFQITCDLLTARYDDKKGATDIYALDAAGNVVISDPPYTAYGDKAVYEVESAHAVLTGDNLRAVTATQTLTAHDKIEYFGHENRMAATGGATATRGGGDSVTADTLTGYFTKDAATGKMAMTKVTASGHVVVKTPRGETVQGDKGVYNVPAQKAELTGAVRLLQGENWLEGTRATVDMKTGVSQLFAEGRKDTEGRVKGVFYPKQSGQ